MNVVRRIAVGFFSFVCITAISGTVYLATLQTTILNRNVVKNWLVESNIYDGRLMTLFVQNTAATNESEPSITPTPQAVTTALQNTFPSNFVQAEVNQVIDNAYDWMESKSANFTFSIPIDEKRDTLITQLSKALEPQVAALPVCTENLVASNTLCRPDDQTPAQYAQLLTSASIDKSVTFSQPLTTDTVGKITGQTAASQPNNALLAQLPALRSGATTLLIALPIVAVLAALAAVFGSGQGKRLLATMRLCRRIFFSMLASLLLASIVCIIMKTGRFTASLSGEFGTVFGPLLQIAIGDMALRLILMSGIVAVLAAAGWGGTDVWLRQLQAKQPTGATTT